MGINNSYSKLNFKDLDSAMSIFKNNPQKDVIEATLKPLIKRDKERDFYKMKAEQHAWNEVNCFFNFFIVILRFRLCFFEFREIKFYAHFTSENV